MHAGNPCPRQAHRFIPPLSLPLPRDPLWTSPPGRSPAGSRHLSPCCPSPAPGKWLPKPRRPGERRWALSYRRPQEQVPSHRRALGPLLKRVTTSRAPRVGTSVLQDVLGPPPGSYSISAAGRSTQPPGSPQLSTTPGAPRGAGQEPPRPGPSPLSLGAAVQRAGKAAPSEPIPGTGAPSSREEEALPPPPSLSAQRRGWGAHSANPLKPLSSTELARFCFRNFINHLSLLLCIFNLLLQNSDHHLS